MNEARKHRDQPRTLLFSTTLADLKNHEFELQHPLSDDEAAEVLRRGIKRRREAAEQYAAGGRRGRAGQGLAPGRLLAEFLPAAGEPLDFPAARGRVAAPAAGPLGAAGVKARPPATDPAAIRAALAQVAELAALLLTDDTIRAEPVPDLAPALELLQVAGSALEGAALAGLGRGLAAARVEAAARQIGRAHV